MAKTIYLEDEQRIKIPHKEVICPSCGNKLLFEANLCSFSSSFYCHYCGQEISHSLVCKQ